MEGSFLNWILYSKYYSTRDAQRPGLPVCFVTRYLCKLSPKLESLGFPLLSPPIEHSQFIITHTSPLHFWGCPSGRFLYHIDDLLFTRLPSLTLSAFCVSKVASHFTFIFQGLWFGSGAARILECMRHLQLLQTAMWTGIFHASKKMTGTKGLNNFVCIFTLTDAKILSGFCHVFILS